MRLREETASSVLAKATESSTTSPGYVVRPCLKTKQPPKITCTKEKLPNPELIDKINEIGKDKEEMALR